MTSADSHKQQSNEQMGTSERWACQISKCHMNYTYLLRISRKFTYKSSTERSMSGLQERTEITSLDTLFVISTNSWSLTNFWAKTTWGSQLDFPSETITGLVYFVSRDFLYKIVAKLHLITRWASSQCIDVFCLFQFQIRLYC